MKIRFVEPPLYRKKGPAVKAQFFLGEKGLNKVCLLPSSSKNFEWQTCCSYSQPSIEKVIEEWVDCFCKRRQPTVELPIVLKGLPPYTTQVLSILRDIPFGLSLTYEALAEISGNPKGARAVGNACARNPFPLLIPCHRVLASGNRLGGFSCGLDIKKNLLNFEGIAFTR